MTDQPFHAPGHDHQSCVAASRVAAERAVRGRGEQWTDARRRVFSVLCRAHRAIGAYDIRDALEAEGAPLKPMSIYRSLDFLVAQGLAHRVERLNAFVACAHLAEGAVPSGHGAQLLICRECGAVAEIDDPSVDRALLKAAEAARFAMAEPVVEIIGTCPHCDPDRRGTNPS